MNTKGNPQNLTNITSYSPEKQAEMRRKGGINSQKKRKEMKTVKQIVGEWAEKSIIDEEKRKKLQSYGIEDVSNRSLIVLQLLNDLGNKYNSIKAIDRLIFLLGEDKEKNERIKMLELENERLQKALNGEMVDSKILLINDMPKDDE